jgi:hypothetical protein
MVCLVKKKNKKIKKPSFSISRAYYNWIVAFRRSTCSDKWNVGNIKQWGRIPCKVNAENEACHLIVCESWVSLYTLCDWWLVASCLWSCVICVRMICIEWKGCNMLVCECDVVLEGVCWSLFVACLACCWWESCVNVAYHLTLWKRDLESCGN